METRPDPLHAATAAAGPSQEAQPFAASDQQTPFNWLHQAAESGDGEQIKSVLKNAGTATRNDLLKRVFDGELPIHCAARGGHDEIVELFLADGLPQLSNAPCENGGWSPLHLAAAYGHANVVEWLHVFREVDMNLQDKMGNTPTHLAVLLGHKDVVGYLVGAKADIFILNKDGMMPMSFCSDKAMFEALFPPYLDAPSTASCVRSDSHAWSCDGDERSILHYAAQFSEDPDALAMLIKQVGPECLNRKDSKGDSFLHIAARSGNMHVLEALQRSSSIRPDISQLIRESGSGGKFNHSPALYAFLHNHRDFFDKITSMSKDVGISLRCFVGALKEELKGDGLTEDRLGLFAGTLPTYLALYAKKPWIFDFLLETTQISVTQWDEEHNRTCLHWAVLDKRADIVQKLCEDLQVKPGIQDGDGKTALEHAFEQNNQNVMDIMSARPEFKQYEEKLYRDRDVYVQALNAILVGAALIASVAFAGWLQWPSTADFKSLDMKIFWASNSISFFTAVATMCVTTSALIPTPHRYISHIVNKLQVAIVMDAGLLALSIAAATCAFAAIGFAAVESWTFAYHAIMKATTAAAGCLAIIMWLGFVKQVYECTPPMRVLVSLMSRPRRFCPWLPRVMRRLGLAKSSTSNPGYRSLTRQDLEASMDEDLVTVLRSKTQSQKEDCGNGTRRQAAASRIKAEFKDGKPYHKSRVHSLPLCSSGQEDIIRFDLQEHIHSYFQEGTSSGRSTYKHIRSKWKGNHQRQQAGIRFLTEDVEN